MTTAIEQMQERAAVFAAAKARTESTLNTLGLSSAMIEGYHKMVAERVAQIVGDTIVKAQTQAAYDVTTNMPAKIIGGLGDNQADRTASHAAIHALAKFIGWDLSDAKELAVELLHDVNYHDAAEYLAKYDA